MKIIFLCPISRRSVNERSFFSLTASFYDNNVEPWVLSAPTTISYRIDCLSSGRVVTDWKTVTPATSITITVPSSANAIVDNQHRVERKMLSVRANAGLDTQYQETFDWDVINLPGQY